MQGFPVFHQYSLTIFMLVINTSFGTNLQKCYTMGLRSVHYCIFKQTSTVQCYHTLSITVIPSVTPHFIIICDSSCKQSS